MGGTYLLLAMLILLVVSCTNCLGLVDVDNGGGGRNSKKLLLFFELGDAKLFQQNKTKY